MIVVFAGPTLGAADGAAALAPLEADFRPPVAQGDVFRAGRQGARAVGIVDGAFDLVPAVWHKEILWALAQGIRVYGSASMGALRAAELEPFGMTGVGEVFRLFREGVLEDDDEVAVVHGPASEGYRAQSTALVDIRCTLAAAQAAGVIEEAAREALVRRARARYYPDRTYAAVLQDGAAAGLQPAPLAALRDWLPRGRIDQKRRDALAMLSLMRRQAGAPALPARFTFQHTVFWERAISRAGDAGAPESSP